MANLDEAVLVLTDVRRCFRQGNNFLEVLKSASMLLLPGEIVALVGPSGAGKSTLLHIAGLLEVADSGNVQIAGLSTTQLSDKHRTALRRDYLGFVYQYHYLMPEFSALENVMMPQMVSGISRKKAMQHAELLLERVGLSNRIQHKPGQLSGGEQQRVAIARALANSPQILLADEPTGNLDPQTAKHVFSGLLQLAKADRLSVLIATHNLGLSLCVDRILELRNGYLLEHRTLKKIC